MISALREGILPVKNKPPKAHHLLPRFYLKGFSEKGNILIQELGGQAYQNSYNKAFVVNDFYKLADQDAYSESDFENHLAEVESKAAGALRKLRNKEAIVPEEKAHIAEFLLAQWVRGEDFRDSSKSFANLAIRDMARQSKEEDIRLFHELTFSKLLPDEEWKVIWNDYISENGPGFERSVENNFSQLKSLTLESKKTLLLIRRWVVLDFGSPMLISGDRPVLLPILKRTANGIINPGLAKADEVVFPMSRSLALVLKSLPNADNPEEIGTRLNSINWVQGDGDLANRINRRIAMNSRRKIFGHPSDAEQLAELSSTLNPIYDWATGNSWDEATDRMIEIKDTVVSHFENHSREEIAQVIEESRARGGSSHLIYREREV